MLLVEVLAERGRELPPGVVEVHPHRRLGDVEHGSDRRRRAVVEVAEGDALRLTPRQVPHGRPERFVADDQLGGRFPAQRHTGEHPDLP
jgi:hypothetical protein